MKMMERKAYTAFGETGFGETGRHRLQQFVGDVETVTDVINYDITASVGNGGDVTSLLDLYLRHSVFRSTPPSPPNEVGLKCPSFRPSVRPSVRRQKSFFNFSEILRVRRGQ